MTKTQLERHVWNTFDSYELPYFARKGVSIEPNQRLIGGIVLRPDLSDEEKGALIPLAVARWNIGNAGLCEEGYRKMIKEIETRLYKN